MKSILGIGNALTDILAVLPDESLLKKYHLPLGRMQHVDMQFWLVGDILLKTDKMAMAHSLESRVPFLDREVFRIASSIPVSQKVDEHQTKIALRHAAERVIPVDWAQKQKLGFPVPMVAWLREERYYRLVREAFTSDTAARFFDTDELVRLLDEHRAGTDWSRRVWIVYSFLVWYHVYFEGGSCALSQGSKRTRSERLETGGRNQT